MRLIVRIEYKGREFRRDYVNGQEYFMCNAAPAQVTGKRNGRLPHEEIRSRLARAGSSTRAHNR
jgi:hypothetical protein